ncbi:NifU N-terminal domain-containing protein [Alteribacillus bidgolensis]|uniref:Scaffold protein Nfu/NifU N terminal n=1 Tax=Alteribacillus bidgolensis TaxID=930129 RepID=A0A1G8MFD9_9BACI|nr:NifU N-terminal domain-containing protein [Alteribacillus bidgolensis]SDI66728.1 Scaffold protein Nfu/NifU N terminal [Alteribacillus bidgolensis]
MEVQAQSTPNPNAVKFTADQVIFDGSTSLKKGDETDHPIAKALLQIEGVDNIFGYNDFVTVNKTMDAEWDDLMPKIQQAFDDKE